jgi:dihydrofolate reductase (trimethoprim resistance protein)
MTDEDNLFFLDLCVWRKFKLGDHVRKVRGSQWQGTVVGTYKTELTPEGYCVESDAHSGAVQIYPAAALEIDPL